MSDSKQMIFLVSFSGGKDSVATWLLLERELHLPVRCVFADTGWESDRTYRYLETLETDHGLPLVRIQPKIKHLWVKDPPARIPNDTWNDPLDMLKMSQLKGRSPSATCRFCTTVLKLRPMCEYVHGIEGDAIMVTGVRAEESKKRANMAPWVWDDFLERHRWMPIHEWTADRVFAMHKRHKIPVNPLYRKGCSRVGCWPCVMACKAEIAAVAKDRFGRERLLAFEEGTGRTWFAAGTASKAYQSAVDPVSGKRINWAEDCFRWALAQQPANAADGLFADEAVPLDHGDDLEAESCSSQYGLCE